MSTFIKFLGWDGFRLPVVTPVNYVIEFSECHYGVCFSKAADAKRFQIGDIFYLSRFVERPNDSRIFARGIVLDFDEERDRATASDIERLAWKEQWSYMRRLKNVEFIKGRLENCISLNTLIEKLNTDSFRGSKERVAKGEINVNPRESLMQQSDVELTPESSSWLQKEFTRKIDWLGSVSQKWINNLPRPEKDI